MITETERAGIEAHAAENAIRVVHVIFKTHLDMGFTEYAHEVVTRYFEQYIPQAIALARHFRAADGPERFVWTTGSWLIYEYLERAAPASRAEMEQSIADGDIAWHGLPFTTHSELMDRSLFEFGLSLSQELDRRFGKHTIAAKMTDVPGHTRGIVPPLSRAGIRFLHIGVNPASRPPEVPPVFVWKDPSGAELIVMYHRGSYGDLMILPGLDEAIVFSHTDDNLGPPSAAQVVATFQALQERFPDARVSASTMDSFAQALLLIADQLPRVTGEIGDTWIHGVGSDPLKVARYRELSRLRRKWLDTGMPAHDPRLARFSRALMIVPEHTWGLDEKITLAGDTRYRKDDFQAARATETFRRFEGSWVEQRAYLDAAVEGLGDAPLAAEAQERLRSIQPVRPDITAASRVLDLMVPIETRHFLVRIDPADGAIVYLQDKHSTRVWAEGDHALARYWYQTFAQEDYDRFWRQYVINKRATRSWSWPDQTKPGIAQAGALARTWRPTLAALYHRRDEDGHRLTTILSMPEESVTEFGAPQSLSLELWLPNAEPVLQITLQWFDKAACRLPEAHWLSYQPLAPQVSGWLLEKMGEWISPLEVVRYGNRHLHAVDRGVTYQDRAGTLSLETLDAPLLAPGEPALLNFTNRQPPLRHGMHVNLHNNVWGTNFPMWYEGDARFRFVLSFDARLQRTVSDPVGVQSETDLPQRSDHT